MMSAAEVIPATVSIGVALSMPVAQARVIRAA
jgi:hypothetical protein